MAHIEERGNSVRIRIDCGIDSNGKRKVKSHTIKIPDGTSKRERARMIQAACDEFERKVKGGSSVDNAKLKFKDFVSGLYEKNHLSTLKPKTADGYRTVIRDRLIEYFGEMLLQDITPLDVRKWLASLNRKDGNEKPLSENSKGNWFRTLSAIMGKAEEWELIESNPCKKVKQPRKPQSDVRALSQEDVIKIFNGFEKFEDDRIVILMKILLLTGIRSGECSGLEWGDIDFDNCSIQIQREAIYIRGEGIKETTPKSKSSQRAVFIPMAFCDDLKAYREKQLQDIEDRGDLWIGEKGNRCKLFTQFNGLPVSNFTIHFWVEKYLKWVDVPFVPPHGLRHTFASILIANGMDARTAAAQMGHSQPSLVYNTYANPQDSAKRRAANLMGDLFLKESSDDPGSNE